MIPGCRLLSLSARFDRSVLIAGRLFRRYRNAYNYVQRDWLYKRRSNMTIASTYNTRRHLFITAPLNRRHSEKYRYGNEMEVRLCRNYCLSTRNDIAAGGPA